MITIICAYICIFYFLHQVVTQFRIRDKNTKWHDVNKQIAKVMIVQTSVPLLISFPALTLMWSMYVFKFEGDQFQYLVNILMSIAPTISPYFGIFLVKRYRRTLQCHWYSNHIHSAESYYSTSS